MRDYPIHPHLTYRQMEQFRRDSWRRPRRRPWTRATTRDDDVERRS
jgi:hypothetical protein